jgi:hypothetical protein
MSNIRIYKDLSANAIFFENANGVQFMNSLQAKPSVDGSKIDISDLAKQIDLVSDISHSDFINRDGVTYEQISINNGHEGTNIDVINELNSVFQDAGTPTGEIPTITSPLVINNVQGSIINYELTADYGVGYEWNLSQVSGITTVNGNVRKIIGGSSLGVGSYNIPVKAINYNGEDSRTIVLNVAAPTFANTKSVQFNNQDYLGANAALLDSTLGRSGNGSGSGDAWSIAFWFKAGTSVNNNQTIFYFGANDVSNGNHIKITYQGGVSNGRNINFKYGSNFNYLNLITPLSSVPQNSWCHVIITYDGGTTGSSSGSVNDYYSRFKIYIDGNQQTTLNFNINYGNSTSLSGQNLRVGRYNTGNYMCNSCKIDELATWDSDQSSNVFDIYNSGSPFDLSTLTDKPNHWWRMGDGDTYPLLQDSGTEANCIFQMYNMTLANIVNDVPLYFSSV